MCGIVGVVGNKNATDILMQGLEKLEYRGYDSAGIYVTNGVNQGRLIKSVGRIADLRAKIGINMAGYTGIGHTRWATHGQPTELNAHPHTSETGRFVLVHNGVIENYLQIKETYLSNHHLKGETDTEIAVHLVGEFVEQGLTVLEAFKKALKIIEGSYAFALVDAEDPDTIYVAKNKSPLLIGLGDGYNMVCSDAMAMIRETSEFMEIHDKELVVLTKDSVSVMDYDGASRIHHGHQRQAGRTVVQAVGALVTLALDKHTHAATAAFHLAVESAHRELDDWLHLLLIIAFGNVVYELLNNVEALLYLVQTYHVTCKRVAFGAYNLVELHTVISCIRLNLTQVVVPA